MYCYICVTYLIIIATAHPPKDREVAKIVEKRSIFHDVIESLKIRNQLPEDINVDEDNNLGQNYRLENEPLHLPSDLDFMPRRNDRIEMPTLNYRFPKSLKINESFEGAEIPRKEIVLYVNTPNDNEPQTTTQKPKPQKRPRPRPPVNKINTANKNNSNEELDMVNRPFMNSMAGQSQIGNRDSQTVVKPTVIVNFRGSVSHRDSDIVIEKRRLENETLIPQNVFNINQEIKLETSEFGLRSTGGIKKAPAQVKTDFNAVTDSAQVKTDVNIVTDRGTNIEEDMMMCETSSSKEKAKRTQRKYDIVQIMLAIN